MPKVVPFPAHPTPSNSTVSPSPKRKASDDDDDYEDVSTTENISQPVRRSKLSTTQRLRKCQTSATDAADIKPLTKTELTALSHEKLIAHALALQSQLTTAKLSVKSATASNTGSELSIEDTKKKGSSIRATMGRQIQKAMTWKPSCKYGGAPFSQEFMVPSAQIIRYLFKDVTTKPFKMKKFTAEEFELDVLREELQGKARYSWLELTSDVTCRWNESNGLLKCNGKYGLPGTGSAARLEAAKPHVAEVEEI